MPSSAGTDLPARRRPMTAVERADFDGVAERGAGAMGLHQPDLVCSDAGVGQRGPDDFLLRVAVGHGQAGGRRRRDSPPAAQHSQDRAPLAFGVLEAHQD